MDAATSRTVSTSIAPYNPGFSKMMAKPEAQTTTAAPLCESAMMLVKGNLKGVVLQSEIAPDQFLNGSFVSKVYG